MHKTKRTKRTRRLELRLTDEELVSLTEKAATAGTSVSEFLRQSAYRLWVRNRPHEQLLLTAASNIASHLETLADWITANTSSGRPGISVEILAYLVSIEEELDSLINKFQKCL